MKFPEIKVVTTRVCEDVSGPADTPERMRDLWQAHVTTASWFDPLKEALVVWLVNTRHRLLSFHLVSLGTLNEALAHPREILRPAVIQSAYGLVLMHNHPSGEPDPSDGDRRMTRKVLEASSILEINLLDHVIVGTDTMKHFSFREHGLI